MIDAELFISALELEVIHRSEKTQLDVDVSDLNRPGLQFSGYFDYFASDRVQVLGKVEMTYLDSLDPETRKQRLQTYFSYPMPCVVICRNMHCPDELLDSARQGDVPVYRSRIVTTKFSHDAINFINACLSPRVARHGVLMDVFGVGVLITGESGVGKSETALELVKRGHRLVADDVVDIRQVADERLVGEAPEIVRHFMEIRGIGIIDIKRMYGVGSVINSKSIEMVIHLELWDQNKEYDRLGLTEDFTTILGVRLPRLTVPVRPGRNLAVIVEVAVSNYRLKLMGYHAAKELDERIRAQLGEG